MEAQDKLEEMEENPSMFSERAISRKRDFAAHLEKKTQYENDKLCSFQDQLETVRAEEGAVEEEEDDEEEDEKEDNDEEGDDQNSPQKSTQSGGTLETCESPTTQITSQPAQSTQTAVETVPQSTTASTTQPAAVATRAATNPLQKDMVDPQLEAAACGCCTIS